MLVFMLVEKKQAFNNESHAGEWESNGGLMMINLMIFVTELG